MSKIYHVKFTSLKTNHNRLRTSEVVGITHALPEVGEMFFVIAKPLDEFLEKEGYSRMVNTSPVVSITSSDNIYILETKSGSIYKVEVLS